ncbi:hypothetical protein BGX38DRAFT_1147006 [Terfezia claveryi]|nr:hypothetical protein BGX38DRAFT_1147006 [Terfezia claveryi]
MCHHAFDAAHPNWVMVPTEETLNVQPPQVSEPTPSKSKKRVRGVDEEDKGKGGEEDDGGEGYGREGRKEKRSRVKRQVTPSDRNLRPRRPAKVKFAYGPDSTSQDAIDTALRCLEKHPDSEKRRK